MVRRRTPSFVGAGAVLGWVGTLASPWLRLFIANSNPFQPHFRCECYTSIESRKGHRNASIGAKGRIAMHDIEHKSTQEEPASTPEQKYISTTGRQKLPRSWRYILIGATALLVLALIFAGVLALANQRAKQSPVAGSTPTSGATTLPTSTSTPIPAPVSSDHNVSVMVAGGVAYLGTTDNAVYALRTSNGSLLWRYKIEGSVDAQPLVANGVVYVTSFVGQNGPVYAYALRASDGSLLWRYSGDTYSYLSLSTTDSSLAFVASQGGISALNTSNGTMLWHYNAMKGTDSGFSLEINGVVYFGASIDNVTGTLYALRASNGTPLWHYTTDGY